MKALMIVREIDGDLYREYFVRIFHGLIITTADIDSATRYKNAHGIRIAKGLIKRWGHDCLMLMEDIK